MSETDRDDVGGRGVKTSGRADGDAADVEEGKRASSIKRDDGESIGARETDDVVAVGRLAS